MRKISHVTPRYVYNRFWWWLYERRNMDKPWLTPQAVALLSTLLRPVDVGIEWGSGRSTVWFAKHLSHLTSVEDNEEWYGKVKEQLEREKVVNVTYLHRSTTPGQDGAPSAYVSACNSFPDASLGFALVDGAFLRDQCALAVIPKIATGGMLVIDNINWFLDHPTHSPASRFGKGPLDDTWRRVESQLSTWRMVWTSSGCTDTAIWIRPSACSAAVLP